MPDTSGSQHDQHFLFVHELRWTCHKHNRVAKHCPSATDNLQCLAPGCTRRCDEERRIAGTEFCRRLFAQELDLHTQTPGSYVLRGNKIHAEPPSIHDPPSRILRREFGTTICEDPSSVKPLGARVSGVIWGEIAKSYVAPIVRYDVGFNGDAEARRFKRKWWFEGWGYEHVQVRKSADKAWEALWKRPLFSTEEMLGFELSGVRWAWLEDRMVPRRRTREEIEA